MTYEEFLQSKIDIADETGFEIDPSEVNPALKPHQLDAVVWAIRGGRRALFESFGLGKTAQQLEWARIIHEHTSARVLIILPLGVKQEFQLDAVRLLGWPSPPPYIRTDAEALATDAPITDTTKAYADEPVTRSKDEYTRAQWQIDAHGFWRSSGDRLVTKEELFQIPTDRMQKIYRNYSRDTVYSYEEHVALAKQMDAEGRLPATFMVVAPGSWSDQVWDDINRMRTYNTTQSQRRKQMHVCPLQIDIVQRLIDRYSNPGDTILDPFGGIMTVPTEAVKRGRRGIGIELNADYFRDGVGYLQCADNEVGMPTLFDFINTGGDVG